MQCFVHLCGPLQLLHLASCIDVWVSSEDPERNDILRLEEMMSRESVLINTY